LAPWHRHREVPRRLRNSPASSIVQAFARLRRPRHSCYDYRGCQPTGFYFDISLVWSFVRFLLFMKVPLIFEIYLVVRDIMGLDSNYFYTIFSRLLSLQVLYLPKRLHATIQRITPILILFQK
jgi:hypothetical protein